MTYLRLGIITSVSFVVSWYLIAFSYHAYTGQLEWYISASLFLLAVFSIVSLFISGMFTLFAIGGCLNEGCNKKV